MIALGNLWHELWTGNEGTCFLPDESGIETAFHCDETSWVTIIETIEKLDIEYIEHSNKDIELVAPGAKDFSLRIFKRTYEDDELDFSQLDGLSIEKAIDVLRSYPDKPHKSTPFEYILFCFSSPSVSIYTHLSNRILAISPSDHRFLDFMLEVKEKLLQTSEVIRTAIDAAPEPWHTRAINELKNIESHEALCSKIRQRIFEKGYDKEFSLSYTGMYDVKLSIKINDGYSCSRTIMDSSFEHDIDELLDCCNFISHIFAKHGDTAICTLTQYSHENWEKININCK